jgi:transcriptional regulator with XRE-family HTH domain
MSEDRSHLEPFAKTIHATRKRKRMKQIDVSAASGIHFTEVSRIERGLRDPRLSTIIRLARALKVSPAKLLEKIK